MHMFHQASLKLGLDRAVLAHARNEQEDEANNSKSHSKSLKDTTKNEENEMSSKDMISNKAVMSAKEIDELLKRGAYDVFREDDSEQIEFLEADIDSILERRGHKIDFSQSDGVKSISNSLGGFSKASFVSADQSEDIDINDPDFWKKAVGLSGQSSVVEENSALMSIEGGGEIEGLQQRKRKQTTVRTNLLFVSYRF